MTEIVKLKYLSDENPWLRMKNFLYITANIIGGLFMIVFTLVSGLLVYAYLSYGAPRSQIELNVSYEGVCKKPGFPIFVELVNNSQKAVRWYQARLYAHFPGRNDSLVGNNGYVSDDYIILPSKGRGNCWKVPSLIEATSPSALDWSVELVDVKFEK